MNRHLLIAGVLLLAACGGQASLENYKQIDDGQSRERVIELLGEPDRDKTIAIGGISGSHMAWETNEFVISVQFVDGKAISKQFISTD